MAQGATTLFGYQVRRNWSLMLDTSGDPGFGTRRRGHGSRRLWTSVSRSFLTTPQGYGRCFVQPSAQTIWKYIERADYRSGTVGGPRSHSIDYSVGAASEGAHGSRPTPLLNVAAQPGSAR